jgi:hypothetical protein
MHLSFVKTTLWIGVKRVFTVATARTEVSRLVFDESRAHLTERGATRSTKSTRDGKPAEFLSPTAPWHALMTGQVMKRMTQDPLSTLTMSPTAKGNQLPGNARK